MRVNMQPMNVMRRLFLRFRYPVTLPEDVATALGVDLSNFLSFNEFMMELTKPNFKPGSLRRYMSRQKAEEAFRYAQRREIFNNSSLFSFYFLEGWMEFIMEFDEKDKLRRLYLHHKNIPNERGIEIPLQVQPESPVR